MKTALYERFPALEDLRYCVRQTFFCPLGIHEGWVVWRGRVEWPGKPNGVKARGTRILGAQAEVKWCRFCRSEWVSRLFLPTQ